MQFREPGARSAAILVPPGLPIMPLRSVFTANNDRDVSALAVPADAECITSEDVCQSLDDWP